MGGKRAMEERVEKEALKIQDATTTSQYRLCTTEGYVRICIGVHLLMVKLIENQPTTIPFGKHNNNNNDLLYHHNDLTYKNFYMFSFSLFPTAPANESLPVLSVLPK